MKRLIIIIYLLVLTFSSSKAGEGMWIPSQLDSFIVNHMKSLGSKLSAEQIYSTTNPSLKDAVVWFGRGCTGEVISNKGLILTNYHCGYGQIQSHSTVSSDLLKNGFWSKDQNEELHCPGLKITFIKSIENVTDLVVKELSSISDFQLRSEKIKLVGDSIASARVKGTGYKGTVKSYFHDNEFYLIIMEEYSDIRLVGAPPSSIGKFGGDTDNWVWPRHTGDFALFRIYADKNNEPAEYSNENVPYKPRHSFPISLKGISENDFTMVYGFPARTYQYISSGDVMMRELNSNPAKVEIRRKKLQIIDEAMSANDTIRIMYASKQQRIANAYKKWQGEILGTKRVNTIGRKKKEEAQFENWATSMNDTNYIGITNKLNTLYAKLTPYVVTRDYIREALWGIETLKFIKSYFQLEDQVLNKKSDPKKLKSEKSKLVSKAYGHFKNLRLDIDEKLFISMMQHSMDSLDPNFRPTFFKDMMEDESIQELSKKAFASSIFTDPARFNESISKLSYRSARMNQADPLYKIAKSIDEFEKQKILPVKSDLDTEAKKLMHSYMKGLLEMPNEKILYPDANSTLRVSYGKVNGFEPKDGLAYKYYTTLSGVVEKEDPGNSEFEVDEKLKKLYSDKDFGMYGNEFMYVGFIASNHTTGGNSGSPVINANGELIGTNFDRVWEGTMSDIEFDPVRCRNIIVDIRYTLFIIDKFAGCSRLIDEMKIVK